MVCSSISKTNRYVEKLILTGVFDTTYKGTTAGCNNIRSYGISDKRFSESFGFTTEKVKVLIDKFEKKVPFDDTEKVFNIIKDWYGGYFVPTITTGSSTTYLKSDNTPHTEVFTPWAVMNFLYDSFKDKELSPKSYWSKTGYKTILERLFTQEKCKGSSLSRKFLEISENVYYELNFDNLISLFKYDWHSDIDNEAFFSYLLLNSGYLAGKEIDGKFKFSIPNRELLLEFTNIIPHENRNCKTILENLQKNRQLEILNMIKQNDSSTDFINKFEKKFTTYKINCADNSMHLNFMSLAVIYSNKKVYNNLKILCNDESLDMPDSANDFTTLDYDFVLQRNFFDNNKNNILLFHNTFNDIMCPVLTNYWGEKTISILPTFVTMITLGSVIPYLYKDARAIQFFEEHTTIAKCAHAAPILITLIAAKILADHLTTKEYCKEYMYYQQINITKPNEFTTLKHVKKYVNHHNNVHIVVDSACSKKKDTITEIIQPVFKNPYVTNENIKYTICKITTPQQEKSSYTAFTIDHPQCPNTDLPQEELTNNAAIEKKELAHSETSQANDYN